MDETFELRRSDLRKIIDLTSRSSNAAPRLVWDPNLMAWVIVVVPVPIPWPPNDLPIDGELPDLAGDRVYVERLVDTLIDDPSTVIELFVAAAGFDRLADRHAVAAIDDSGGAVFVEAAGRLFAAGIGRLAKCE